MGIFWTREAKNAGTRVFWEGQSSRTWCFEENIHVVPPAVALCTLAQHD